MKKYKTKLLGLEDVIVKNVWEDEVSRHIEIELPRKEHRRPCCGEQTDKIHDYRKQCIKDCPVFGKQVYLHFRKRRYVCSTCGKRFYESNSFVPRYYRVTSRKCAQIINDFRETVSASHIAREHNRFKGNAGGEKFQCIIADAANHRPVDILPNRKKSELIRYFRGFESRKDVKYVVIDMNAQFGDVAELCFPNATIVIDRFHVTRLARLHLP